MDPMTDPSTEWWRALYDDAVADLLLERVSRDEARACASALARMLALRPSARVFDQCCGVGTYAVALAEAGYSVVGCDLTAGYVARTRAKAAEAGVSVDAHVADAFAFTPAAPCDAALNLGTSFGYADDARNAEMLRRAYESLRPGGMYALDFMNLPGVLRGFRAVVQEELQRAEGALTLVRETRLDLAGGWMHKRWTWRDADGAAVGAHDTTVRAYMPWELAGCLRSVGFEVCGLHGSLQGAPLELDSPRCVVLGRRPA
ncbi:MAG: class I SAM-dependent methyltransferase [Planctomycetota bacterium]